tara:strand:+ start:6866 stop:7081 length:216 start_codon:yes stop_codon:yes gene_type:complete
LNATHFFNWPHLGGYYYSPRRLTEFFELGLFLCAVYLLQVMTPTGLMLLHRLCIAQPATKTKPRHKKMTGF